jgi:hypothetical protein
VESAAENLFAPTYREARERLQRAARHANAGVDTHEHPGPSIDEQPLYADVVRIGSHAARRVLLIVSGTHGIEGFAGSAIQTDCMQRLPASRLPNDVAIMLIHGLNPYGFAWYRRVDQDNVDVNRNVLDHAAGHAENREYDALHAALCPPDWNETTRCGGEEALIEFQARHGRNALENVLARGQHRHADGLFFGGRAPSWSNGLLRSVLAGLGRHVVRLVLLDIHTGLGPYAACQLICGIDDATPRAAEVRGWLGDAAVFLGPASGFERLPGAIDSASELASPGLEFTPITVEFGTLPALEVLQALRADNWLHQASPRPDLDCPIKRNMRRAFCPDDPDWQEMVLLRGRQVVARALQGLST